MSATRPPITGRIVRNPEILGGEPILEGTRLSVRIIVLAHYFAHGDIAQVCRSYPQLMPSHVQAALDYYADHKEEIDHYIAENQ